ncbi:GAF domain-containing protein [Agrilutibacter solisilvae]|uniref:GAF domain-containing protein n=1 Tax=Agrilutibacter solisilvae TaxID=2763317 RepID=A0A974XZY4_9GAMM|nr:GAF domain-containing protein [Lysobacter solisilvae]QSX78867.1 GAF domain-containing protein [Lysobacter solisilvae]
MTAAPEFERQRALDTYRIVDTLPEAAYEDIVRLAAAICGVPIALVSLIDRDRQWFKARVGVDLAETPRDEAVCNHAIGTPEALLEVADLARDPRFAHFPVVTGPIGARFYAGMPLVTPGGAAIGTVCVIDREPRVLSDDQRGALESLARLTVNLLEGRQREHVLERATFMSRGALHAPAAAPPGFTVALFELQGYAELATQRGERGAEQLLAQLDRALESRLQASLGDTLNRCTGSAEFVAVLHGDAASTLRQLREAADHEQGRHGVRICSAAAEAVDAAEPLEQVFLRADRALSQARQAG